MSKFNFSPEALDEGLTLDEIVEFDAKVNDFQETVRTVDLQTADADKLRELHNQWLSVGVELFHVSTKALAARAVKEVPQSVRESVGQSLFSQIKSIFDRFRGGT